MWNAKGKHIPVLICENRTISKSHRQYMSNRRTNYDIKKLQKQPLLDTADIWESSNVKVQNIFKVLNNIIFSTNCKYNTAPKLYAIKLFCLSYKL
jgi:hypothetical protein